MPSLPYRTRCLPCASSSRSSRLRCVAFDAPYGDGYLMVGADGGPLVAVAAA